MADELEARASPRSDLLTIGADSPLQVQLGQLVLSRLLLLVALLDHAMAGALPQGVPLLFNLRSRIKGSGQVGQGFGAWGVGLRVTLYPAGCSLRGTCLCWAACQHLDAYPTLTLHCFALAEPDPNPLPHQVLQAILPGWLSGEGDVLRSLGRLGYRLQYEQQPKREVNFAVANLAVDLRDGLRLCKLADVLLGRWLTWVDAKREMQATVSKDGQA